MSAAGQAGGPVVVKLGGRPQGDPALPAALAAVWRATGGALVLVHGGGDQISALQQLRGETPTFVGGRRVTTEGVLELVRMVLSGLANKQLVSALVAAGVPAVGISGEDAGVLRATPLDEATFGFAGTPSTVDPGVVRALLAAGYLPVISPVAARPAGEPAGAYNVNGDDAAAAIAAALGARELFLLADVPGVLDGAKARIPRLTLAEAAALVASGVAGGGMAAKLEACGQALAGGVPRVRIGDLAALAVPEAGTALVPEAEMEARAGRITTDTTDTTGVQRT